MAESQLPFWQASWLVGGRRVSSKTILPGSWFESYFYRRWLSCWQVSSLCVEQEDGILFVPWWLDHFIAFWSTFLFVWPTVFIFSIVLLYLMPLYCFVCFSLGFSALPLGHICFYYFIIIICMMYGAFGMWTSITYQLLSQKGNPISMVTSFLKVRISLDLIVFKDQIQVITSQMVI